MSETKECLEEFYAVTMSRSLYLAKIARNNYAMLIKIGEEGEILTDEKKFIDSMLEIARCMALFNPVGCNIASIQSELMMNACRSMRTNGLVALFLDEGRALLCSGAENLQPRDTRRKDETVLVLKAIGANHPRCSIQTRPSFWLLPPSEWQ